MNTHQHKILAEFTIFHQSLKSNPITSTIVSTPNPYLLSPLVWPRVQSSKHRIFILWQRPKTRKSKPSQKYEPKPATEKDAQWIYQCDNHSRITTKEIDINDLFTLESNGHKIGYGKLSRNPLQQEYSDIGAWALPQFRSKGYGASFMVPRRGLEPPRSFPH